jgi:hypothetical protein
MPIDPHRDPSPRVGKLAGVVQEIAHHLRESRRITLNPNRLRRRRKLDGKAVALQQRSLILDLRAHDMNQVEPMPPKQHFALADAGYVQQVVYQPRQLLHLPIDDDACPLHAPGILLQSEYLQGAADGSERVAQLVAEEGQELVLVPIGFRQELG